MSATRIFPVEATKTLTVEYHAASDMILVRQPPLYLPLTRDEAQALAEALTDAVDAAERVEPQT